MGKMKYKILVPQETIVYKDDGKKIVLFLIDLDDEEQVKVYCFLKEYIHTHLLDKLLKLNYSNRGNADIYKEIIEESTKKLGAGLASDLCDVLLKNLYVADLKNGEAIFQNGISNLSSIIRWDNSELAEPPSEKTHSSLNRKWLYICSIGVAAGILLGIIIALIPGWIDKQEEYSLKGNITQNTAPKFKVNAIYDSKTCTVYFGDTKFETIEYYIDYQKKVKNIDDINWKLQASIISNKDTLFLKDNCVIYLRGEKDTMTSDIQVISVSYYDFITELLVTQDPLIKSMLVTNSSNPFGNTTFLVDGIPQQVSYYKSSELRNYIKKGFRVTSIKTIGSNLNPTNKNYPKLAKITIQKQ